MTGLVLAVLGLAALAVAVFPARVRRRRRRPWVEPVSQRALDRLNGRRP